jgi:hypothetical protein
MTLLKPTPTAETVGIPCSPSTDGYTQPSTLQANFLRRDFSIDLPLAPSLAPLIYGGGSQR